MRPRLRTPLILSALLSVTACDAQGTPDYQGESLLSIVGSVTIESPRTEGALVPALAFSNEWGDRLDIMEVGVRGEFPASFTLDVYTPPPESAWLNGPPGEPHFALGYITAVPENHPDFIRFANASSTSGGPGACDESACLMERKLCTADERECYSETLRCDTNGQDCKVVESSGDPTLKDDPWKSFAGLSLEYLVLYLEGAVRADDEIAHVFGGGQALAAGYHLLHVRGRTETEDTAAEACAERAASDAVDAFNAAHGTSYSTADELGGPCMAGAASCERPSGEDLDAFYEDLDRRERELKCPINRTVYTRIEPPDGTPITVRIAPDIRPGGLGD